MRLNGKVALVTGAGDGIGKAIALRFAKEGAHVVVNDINPSTGKATVDEIRKKNGKAEFIQGDVGQPECAEKMVELAVNTYGRLDVLVNNAGIEVAKTIFETTVEDWEKIMHVNMKGLFLVAKQAALQMVKQGGGSIINISSLAGLIGFPLLGAYCATKHGVLGLTKVMALELRQRNVRVNAICPAFIKTPLLERTLDHLKASGFDVMALTAQMQVRLGTVEEVADAALFLASDESSFINGIALPVDNGFLAT